MGLEDSVEVEAMKCNNCGSSMELISTDPSNRIYACKKCNPKFFEELRNLKYQCINLLLDEYVVYKKETLQKQIKEKISFLKKSGSPKYTIVLCEWFLDLLKLEKAKEELFERGV